MPDSPEDARLQRHAARQLMKVLPVADELGQRFAAAGHELSLVGGSVRDALRGEIGDDLDFATDAPPERISELVERLGPTWTTGAAFGTVGVQVEGLRCEITTYRSDVYIPESRKPQVSFGDSLAGDLERRDFTVNAMAFTVPGHELVDPYGGRRDLAARLLRTPGPAARSFDDDPLRMLRAARFRAQLGFVVDDATTAAVRARAERLAIVSAERIQGELTKLMLGRNPRLGVEFLTDTGLADIVLPELPRLRRLETDRAYRHKDVYAHTLQVLDQAIMLETAGPDLVLRLAALLHDIGKPDTRKLEAGGKVSFHHHELVGAQMTRERLRALKFPKEVVHDVARLVELHLRFHGYLTGWNDSAVRRYVRDAGPLLGRLHALTRADCTTRNARKAQMLRAAYDDLEARIVRLAQEENLKAIRPDLDGRQVMELLGVRPGPVVGEALQHLLELRMERGPLPHEAAVAELLRWGKERDISPPPSTIE